MTDVDQLLRDLSRVAQSEEPPAVDVRQGVLKTLAARHPVVRLDFTPLVLAAFTATVAVIVAVVCFPAWVTMSDPWVALLP